MSGHMSMIIDARSTEFGDFSGPHLDDHLSFRSHGSGHEGLAGIQQSDVAEHEDDDRCISGILGVVGKVPRVEEVVYEEVGLRKGEEPSIPFEIGGRESSDVSRPPPKSMNENPSAPTPQPRPRSYSGDKMLDAQKPDVKPQPMPRPMSQQNLLSTQIPTPPRSPQCDKPVAKPRRKKVSPTSDTPLVREPDTQAASETLPSMGNDDSINTMSTLPSSNITSVYSTSLSLQCDTTCINEHLDPESLQHSEAHTSHESDSPHPSFEQTPSMSAKSDPHLGTSHDNASSACSGDKIFTETNVEDSLGSWVQIEVESRSQPSSLDSAPIRKRADAFSTRPEKWPVTPDVTEICYDPRLVQVAHDIQNGTPCWYCTNLTNDRICEICGNEQEQPNTDTRV